MSARALCAPRNLSTWRRRPRSVLAGVAATLALSLAGLSGLAVGAPPAAAAAGQCAAGAVGCFPRMALGLATAGLPKNPANLDGLEASLGRQADVALTFTSFRFVFDVPNLRALALTGAMPMITWEPFDATAPTENRYPLRGIAAGANDAYLRAQAVRINSLGKPIAMRFGHEMNASWYPWGAGVNGNTPADYVAAYRHVHDIFAEEGVHNVTWVWSPASLDTQSAPPLGQFYPGDEYVDWAGLSVYYDQPTDTWTNTVLPTLRQFDTVAPDAPIFLAETGVLPGPTRPALIHELLGSLLRTPRAIGFTWFNVPSREDWRIDADPAALAAVREELSSDWYGAASVAAGPAPLLQVAPALSGVARVGESLTTSTGVWRGATSTAGRWLLCDDGGVASCEPAGQVGAELALTPDSLGQLVRHEVTATSPGGAAIGISAPSAAVLMVPDRPTRPQVEARSGGARVRFPVAPLGTTHWRLRLDGSAMQLIPVAVTDYWLTGLVNGTTHTLSLAAVASSSAATLESPTTAGTFTPMSQQYSPYVSVTGAAAAFSLPKAPVGAQAWLLTVNGVEQPVPITTPWTSVSGLPTGQPVTWTLVAAAGTWEGAGYGGFSVPSTGSFTPLATPAAPAITPGAGTITLTMPPAPAGATGWRVSVGSKTYPDLPAGTSSFTAGGLYPGYPSSWTLRAVNALARSVSVTGTAAAS